MSFERSTITRLSLQRLSKRFGSLRHREYAKVEDAHDTRVPLHNEDVFQHGLTFKAKYIGSLEITRPGSKIDIITAMRRIRYEFKVKGIRKMRCALDISTDGVRVLKRKHRRRRKQYTENQLTIMQHPIYRIFYVSHDSQDLKIFSYITRESPDNSFRCNVFKAYKKSMALHVVRSLGQAFEVCHKMNPRPVKGKAKATKEAGEKGAESAAATTEGQEEDEAAKLDAAITKLSLEGTTSGAGADLNKDFFAMPFDPFVFPGTTDSTDGVPNGMMSSEGGGSSLVPPPPLTMFNTSESLPDFPGGASGLDIAQAAAIPPPHAHLAYMSRPRPRATGQPDSITENPFTEQQTGGSSPTLSIGEALGVEGAGLSAEAEDRRQLVAQLSLMRDQLKVETGARIESQARVEHLLVQNKELLSHLQKLMTQLQQIQSLHLAQLSSQAATVKVFSSDSQATTSQPAGSEPSAAAVPSTTDQKTPEASPQDALPPPVPVASSTPEPPADKASDAGSASAAHLAAFPPARSASPVFETPSPPISSPQPLLPADFVKAPTSDLPLPPAPSSPTDHALMSISEAPEQPLIKAAVEPATFDPFTPFAFALEPLVVDVDASAVPDNETGATFPVQFELGADIGEGVKGEGEGEGEGEEEEADQRASHEDTSELLVTLTTS